MGRKLLSRYVEYGIRISKRKKADVVKMMYLRTSKSKKYWRSALVQFSAASS
jgi:hypothetical protein